MAPPSNPPRRALQRVDIFCRVVDNYGDAGVCLRLARQLAHEHELDVTLYVDVPHILGPMSGQPVTGTGAGRIDGVRVRALQDTTDADVLPEVVVEAFGCGLPANYLAVMTGSPAAPCWINLEYLSAEPWIETVHGLPSPQPRLPLTRHFFMPGLTAGSGGVLRERGLIEQRNAWQAHLEMRTRFWRTLGHRIPQDALAVSLFCYANAALPSVLDAWADGNTPVFCAVPHGVADPDLVRWLGRPVPRIGDSAVRGRLTVASIPFLPQADYDRLLWSCDVNFVRGEDSFVRAQWAARPLVWQAYPQAGEAQLVKMDAFLQRYFSEAAADAAAVDGMQAMIAYWNAWNRADGPACAKAWPSLRASLPALTDQALRWASVQAAYPDLAGTLLEFARDRI